MPHFDSWPWKLAIVLALVGMREFVRLLSPKEASTPSAQSAGETSRWLIETLDSAAIAIGLVLFIIQPFLLQAFYIPSGSMENTLQIKDRLLVSKLVYRLRPPHFQDVVVFRAPPEALRSSGSEDSNPGEETDYIKRCIGTPGDVVYAENRKYYHNGQLLDEPYVHWSQLNGNVSYSYDMKIVEGVVYSREYEAPGVPGVWRAQGIPIPEADQERINRAKPGPVPEGKFLMLGDHRNNSNDSHEWGFVPRANVVGKAVCVFWPPTRLGLLDRMSFHPRAADSPSLPATEPITQP
ncbi:MAG: signal peptidase I [Abitibacteriaceae bacterium]|nr:signal peptidase I [Abditibacteriaceae bacterium]